MSDPRKAPDGSIAPDNISPDEERSAFPDDELLEREDVPDEDAAVPADELPVTQEDDPIFANLGEHGQGDLAPEDDPRLDGGSEGPDDLRVQP